MTENHTGERSLKVIHLCPLSSQISYEAGRVQLNFLRLLNSDAIQQVIINYTVPGKTAKVKKKGTHEENKLKLLGHDRQVFEVSDPVRRVCSVSKFLSLNFMVSTCASNFSLFAKLRKNIEMLFIHT